MATPKHRTASSSSYFVTTKCGQGRAIFQVAENAEILIRTILDYSDSGAFSLHAFVVMPDHIDLLVTPGDSTSLEKAVQLIKGGSSYRMHREHGQKMEIWQIGFHDRTTRDEEDWRSKVEYIHTNPVRARLEERPGDWLHSSSSGRYTMDVVPEWYSRTSGAKTQNRGVEQTRGLKPPPAEEERSQPVPQWLKPIIVPSTNVGPEGPTPGALTQAGLDSVAARSLRLAEERK